MNDLDIETIDWEFENKMTIDIADLEETVLSCLIQKPELMNELFVTEKDFYKYPKIFTYIKKFYETFHCLDLVLMTSKTDFKERNKFVDTFSKLFLFGCTPVVSNFKLYQEMLLKYNKQYASKLKKEQIRKQILQLAIELQEEKITVKQYFDEIQKLEKEYEVEK